jgi:hypothetical protein
MTVLVWAILAADPTVETILEKLTENQTRAHDLRRQIVYRQDILTRMHGGDNKLKREEKYEYLVVPTEKSFERKLVNFAGKYERHGRFMIYDRPEYQYQDIDIDGSVISEITEDWTGDKESRDGMSDDLFPLTREKQKHYDFSLGGAETYRGRTVWKIAYRPKKDEDFEKWWAGEALVDREQFQPVLITSHQSKGVPMAVKVLLGTDIRKMGFKVDYRDFGDGLWFPEKYGGELDVRVLFGYRRKISISMVNSDVKRAKVESTIKYDPEAQKP